MSANRDTFLLVKVVVLVLVIGGVGVRRSCKVIPLIDSFFTGLFGFAAWI